MLHLPEFLPFILFYEVLSPCFLRLAGSDSPFLNYFSYFVNKIIADFFHFFHLDFYFFPSFFWFAVAARPHSAPRVGHSASFYLGS